MMINLFKYFGSKKVGLALGSGGSKGISHIAVIEFLSRLGIPIDLIAGSSIGSIIGSLHACGSLERFKYDLLALKKSEMISLFDPVFPKSGLIEGEKFISYLSNYIPKSARLEDLSLPLYIVATDFFSGDTIVFDSGSVLDAIRASISIPGVLVPVRHGPTLLVDGGVANPLPITVLKDRGAAFTIAVNLHPTVEKVKYTELFKESSRKDVDAAENNRRQPAGQENGKRAVFPPENGDSDRGIMHYFDNWFRAKENEKQEEKLPNIFEVIGQSIDIMEYMITEMILRYHAPTVLIEPNLVEMKTLDFSNARMALDEGTKAAELAERAVRRKIKRYVS